MKAMSAAIGLVKRETYDLIRMFLSFLHDGVFVLYTASFVMAAVINNALSANCLSVHHILFRVHIRRNVLQRVRKTYFIIISSERVNKYISTVSESDVHERR